MWPAQDEHRAVVGKARAPFFASGTPPASTLVGVAALALPRWLVEIEADAVVGSTAEIAATYSAVIIRKSG